MAKHTLEAMGKSMRAETAPSTRQTTTYAS